MTPEQVIERACARHGGAAAEAVLAEGLRLRLSGLGGMVPRLKGMGLTFRAPTTLSINAPERTTTFHDYPERAQITCFRDGAMEVDGVRVGAPGTTYRRRFRGLAKLRPWTDVDAAYFFGYALLDYASLPFSLRGKQVVRHIHNREGDELWIRTAPGADTHSELQGYRFDHEGLLVRHDYRAEIMGAPFNGAHHSLDYTNHRGLLVAGRRVVRGKAWHLPVRTSLGIPVLWGRLEVER